MKKVLYLLFALFTFSLAHSAVLDTDRKEEKKIEIKNLTIDYSIDLIALFQVERKEFGILKLGKADIPLPKVQCKNLYYNYKIETFAAENLPIRICRDIVPRIKV